MHTFRSIIAIVMVGFFCTTPVNAEHPAAHAPAGTFIGKSDIKVFLGIPYAKPPVGELRWKPPQELPPQDDAYYSENFGKSSLQNTSRIDEVSEDCLYLNLRTPALDDARRPVCVFIHGGGFSLYSGSDALWQGNSFAEDGVVFVTINYRLGASGFLYLDEIDPSCKQTGYLGLLDQIAALRWVQKNVAAFGGDPDNVTIMGESAGAASVCLLMSMPEARGLFHKAIAESGATNLRRTRAAATGVARQFMQAAGVDTVGELRKLSSGQLLQAQKQAMLNFGLMAEEVMFAPVSDGTHLPDDPLNYIKNGAAKGVPLLCGTNRDEFEMFRWFPGASLLNFTTFRWFSPSNIKALTGRLDSNAAEFYEKLYPQLNASGRFIKAGTDAVFFEPLVNVADAQAGCAPVYFYRFDWQSRMGAFHGLELCFVFNDIDARNYDSWLGKRIPQKLRDNMHNAWVEFMKSGSPSGGECLLWMPYDTTYRPTFIFNDKLQLRCDPDKIVRQYWQSRDARDGALYCE